MRRSRYLAALVVLGLVAFVTTKPVPVRANLYNLIATIQIAGAPVASSDIIWVDPGIHRGYVADRSNSGIDVFDTQTNQFIGRIASAGTPNGVTADPASHLVLFGGTDSRLYVGDPNGLTVLGSVSTNGTGRADELAADPRDKVALIANDQAVPPFVSLISYANPAAPVIISQLPIPQATAGLEQPLWDGAAGAFFEAIPTFAGKGAVVRYSFTGSGSAIVHGSLQIAAVFPLDASPQGLSKGPDSKLFVGTTTLPEVIDENTGALVAKLAGAGPAADEVWADPNNGRYLFNNGLGVANIFDVNTYGLIEGESTGLPTHNLADDAFNGSIFVVAQSGNPTCSRGCIEVFSQNGTPPPGAIIPTGSGPTPVNTGSNVVIIPTGLPTINVPTGSGVVNVPTH